MLHRECQQAPAECVDLQVSAAKEPTAVRKLVATQRAYMHADFCLHPQGDTLTRQALFDSILCLCIPVFFATCLHRRLAFEHMYDPWLPAYERGGAFGAGAWAVLLNATQIAEHPGSLQQMLHAIDHDERDRMRRTLRKLVPRVQWASGKLNAFESAGSILRQVLREKGLEA